MRYRPLCQLLAAGGLAAAVLAGCSGSGEDVRVTFCKDLVVGLTGVSGDVEWSETRIAIHRPSHAITTVRLTSGDRAHEGACHFKWVRGDHSAMAVANPIEEYRTLPYRMSLDGHELGEQALLRAVRAEQLRRGKSAVEDLQDGVKSVTEQVRAGIGS
jgi:hypothetical protein